MSGTFLEKTAAPKLTAETAAIVSMVAQRRALAPSLLAALIQTESGGYAAASRHEPGYEWLWDVRGNRPVRASLYAWAGKTLTPRPGALPFRATPESEARMGPTAAAATEFVHQMTSWGLCQVMGATARSLGFDGESLVELSTDAALGADIGAKYLATLMAKWELSDAISAYNAGHPTDANQAYVQRVSTLAERYSREGF